jgi:hypothetical protein
MATRCGDTAVIPAHGRLRQENHEFEASLGYTVTPCLDKNKTNKKLQQQKPE